MGFRNQRLLSNEEIIGAALEDESYSSRIIVS